MCGGGGTQTTTSSTAIDPQMLAMLTGNYNRAEGIANRPFEAFGGQRVAGLNADDLGAMDMMRQTAAGSGQDFLNRAGAAAHRASNYRPEPVAAAGFDAAQAGNANLAGAAFVDRNAVRNLAGGQVAGADISALMNPYQSQVIDQGLAKLDTFRQRALNGTSGQYTRAGAFGGSRHGVADSLTNEAFGQQAQDFVGSQLQQGYDRATGLLSQDMDRRLQADSANQSVDLNVAGQNAGYGQQAGLANAGWLNDRAQSDAALRQQSGMYGAQATNAARMANQQAGLAGAGINLQGADLLGNLSGQQLSQDATRAGLLGAVGQQQRGLQQQGLDFAFDEFMRRQNLPYQQQQMLTQALGLMPNAGTTTQTAPGPDRFGQALGAGAGILSAFLMSDERVKQNVRTAHHDDQGRRWVDFEYIHEPGVVRRGVIAQEVLKTDPDAVREIDGVLHVDYAQLGAH